MKIQTGRILILVTTVVLFIFIGEISLAKFFPQKTFSRAYGSAIKCFNKSSISMFSLKPNCQMNLRVSDSDKDILTATNSLGYRGEDFETEKRKGEARILVEGDSFVLGFGVEDREVFTKVLEEKLGKDVKVINAGYAGGMGPDGYYLQLKNSGMKLQPDLVVFSLFVYNDFTDVKDNDWWGSGKYGEPDRVISNVLFVDDSGVLLPKDLPYIYKLPILKNSQLAVLAYNGFEKAKEKASWLYDRIRFSVFKPETPVATVSDSNFLGNFYSACLFGNLCQRKAMHLFDDVLSVVLAARDLVESQFNDGKTHFLVMIIPSDFQINANLKDKYQDTGIPYNAADDPNPNPQRRLAEMFDQNKIKYLDLLPIFRGIKDNLYYKTDGHWNALGHKAAAEALYNWISKTYGSDSAR